MMNFEGNSHIYSNVRNFALTTCAAIVLSSCASNPQAPLVTPTPTTIPLNNLPPAPKVETSTYRSEIIDIHGIAVTQNDKDSTISQNRNAILEATKLNTEPYLVFDPNNTAPITVDINPNSIKYSWSKSTLLYSIWRYTFT